MSKPASTLVRRAAFSFESNFPIDQPSCSYRTLWNGFKRIAAQASAEEKALLFRDNAVRFYRLDVNNRRPD